MKNIIFIAPPAAGKGTVSARICDKYNIPEQERASFVEKPIGQLITMLNEYSINNMA